MPSLPEAHRARVLCDGARNSGWRRRHRHLLRWWTATRAFPVNWRSANNVTLSPNGTRSKLLRLSFLCEVFRRRGDDIEHALRQRVASEPDPLARLARTLDQQESRSLSGVIWPLGAEPKRTTRSGSVAAISRPSSRSSFLRSRWPLGRPHGRWSPSLSFRGHFGREVIASFLRLVVLGLGGSPRGPVLPHALGDRLPLLLRHGTLPPDDRLGGLLPAAPSERRRGPFDRLDGTLHGNQLTPERLLFVPQGLKDSVLRNRHLPSLHSVRHRIVCQFSETHDKLPPWVAAWKTGAFSGAVGAALPIPLLQRTPAG